MAGTMALSGSCTVFAAEAEAEAETQTETTAEENSVKWEDVAPAVEEADWSGDFVTFDEIAIKMFVPDVLHAAELTEEDKEQGYISYFTTEDEAAAVSVMYVEDVYKRQLLIHSLRNILAHLIFQMIPQLLFDIWSGLFAPDLIQDVSQIFLHTYTPIAKTFVTAEAYSFHSFVFCSSTPRPFSVTL